jgi:hypothetical protein
VVPLLWAFHVFFFFVVGGAQVALLVWASKQLETG